ncbi:hypothetical protein AMK20_06690 [Streptomyces sp. TSRI0261]|nr:hypothetical protein AMK20_06690 [Streptomyces sp. TSRI0261]
MAADPTRLTRLQAPGEGGVKNGGAQCCQHLVSVLLCASELAHLLVELFEICQGLGLIGWRDEWDFHREQ